MKNSLDLDDAGVFDARYVAFLETSRQLRPSLHRYCSRMTGSVLDGEDVVQDALFQAYRKLDSFDEERPMAPWLFQIAHNRCIDFLRRREVREEAEAGADRPDVVMPTDPSGAGLGRAVEHLVLELPPMERACILLKDVLDHSLEETAGIVGSTVGAVKAALSRGRAKLAALPPRKPTTRAMSADLARLLGLYVERFTQRDWDGLRELIAADARLRVADRFAGALSESPYFGNYARFEPGWRMVVGEVDGEPVGIGLALEAGTWAPKWIVRISVDAHRIVRIADYMHTPWLIPAAASVVVAASGAA
jgi:RNA polymerase sigma-70 factor (ECF subfamily)